MMVCRNIHAILHGFYWSFFITERRSLISSILMLPSGCDMLCYMLEAQMCVQPQLVPHRGNALMLYYVLTFLTVPSQSARTLRSTRVWLIHTHTKNVTRGETRGFIRKHEGGENS
jgi:hypothetical protein